MGYATTCASFSQPNVDSAVLGACPVPVAGIGEESIVTARRGVRVLLAVAVGIATALIVSSVIVVVVASLVVITTLIVAMPLVLMTRLIIGPLILCVRGRASERRERDRQRRHSNSTALMGSRHACFLLRVCDSNLYHSAHKSATLTASQAVLRHLLTSATLSAKYSSN